MIRLLCLFNHYPFNQRPFNRRFWITTLLTFSLALSACNSFTLPGPEPTGQPAAVAAEQQQFSPTLTLNPPSGYAGIYVQVTGTGWPPNMMVVVILTDPSGISTTVASKDTDGAGNLSTGFLYPIDSRWLLQAPYVIAAESADGQYRATAPFTVVEPGAPTATSAAPTAIAMSAATATATPLPTLTSTPQFTVTPQPTTQPTATAQPTATPTVAPSPTPEASAAETAPSDGNEPPVITAELRFDEERSGSRQRFHIEVEVTDADDDLRAVTAILLIPPLDQVELEPGDNDNDDGDDEHVRLRERGDRFDIKVNEGKLEITAPEPQAVLDMIKEYGGIEVQPGQTINYKTVSDDRFRFKLDDELLVVDAAELLLQVTAVDEAGLSHQVTVSPAGLDNEAENRDNGEARDDNKDDNKDDDDD